MKRLMVLLTALLCLALCACGAKAPSIVGTWKGSGTVSIIGENSPNPVEITEHWTFEEDGTAAVEITTPETSFPATEFTYTLDNGILNLTANGRSTEFSCVLDAETMRLADTIVFTRVK